MLIDSHGKSPHTEKLQIIEQLWDELSRNPDDVLPPTWHANARREAENAIANGDAGFQDGEQAKTRLRQGAA